MSSLPMESSDTEALVETKEPGPQNLSAPNVEWKSLITPVGTFILGAVLAFGHHAFNAWVDGRPVATIIIPQNWVTRIGVGLSFGFKTALGATMAFVLLQCLWVSVRSQPLTIREINTLYHIERADQLYKTLPQALSFSRIIVAFTVLTLLLPLSGVLAPGSLTVTTKNDTNVNGPCTIPTGNFSTPNAPDLGSLSTQGGAGNWTSATPRATTLTTQWFVGQRIPDLPQACGPDCRYKLSIPSFVFQCTPNPPSLPFGQGGIARPQDQFPVGPTTLWNGTTDPNSMWAFYIAWNSNGANGTAGNASCSPVLAQYDVEVQTKGGVQSVTTNITQVTSPLPDVANPTLVPPTAFNNSVSLWMGLASLSYATRALLLGTAVFRPGPTFVVVEVNTEASQASFLDIPLVAGGMYNDGSYSEYVWRDVLKGIEDLSHNVTAALLTLQLGTMLAECFFDRQTVVFEYTPFELWAPYGAALCVALISIVFAAMIMAKNNTGHITTSFSDTVMLTRNIEEEVGAGTKLRLRLVKGREFEYTVE
ncbi:hypothetical protein GALMADRAFT_136510 [Galerina marginata CBS 339.88]|uniref:Transmembrane protein n=1 Tax=Galerina marginata (strain CBS 339.88) TaxID=685588 RepID=A0A067TLZ0_GALM3|nr:hypothetical protein GALMADRAFT_136510 [Galerina marginata CBS 339.88]